MPFHEHLPLVAVNDVHAVWAAQPTFVVAECLFLCLFVVCLVGVLRAPPRHLLLLWACVVGGGAIELLTILEKDHIGNFYHSQAVVMLFGRREPLYMLVGCYGWFQFVSVALPWRVGMGWLGEAAAAALMCSLAWGLLDAVGLKNLWWTWHNTEPLYVDRHLGVPVASTFWIASSAGALAVTVRAAQRLVPSEHGVLAVVSALVAGTLVGPFATVVLMQAPFMLFYHPLVTALGLHARWALLALHVACALAIVRELAARGASFSLSRASSLLVQVLAFVCVMGGVVWHTRSHNHEVVRTSFSQPFGGCGVKEASFWGAFDRERFVCPEGVDPERDLYSFHCVAPEHMPAPNDTWYTVCGTPAGDDWVRAVGATALLLVLLAGFCDLVRLRTAGKASGKAKARKRD